MARVSGRQRHDTVAVVIPTHNRWALLRTALAGALAQRNVEVEVIVVDDGSTDQTAAQLANLHEPRLRVVRHDRPRGVSAARNHGLQYATAPWVAFLDDDDVWAPDFLASMLEAVRASDLEPERVALVFSSQLEVDGDRRVTAISPAEPAQAIRDGLLSFNLIGGPSRVLLRTATVRAVGGFDPGLSIIADWDLWFRVLAHGEAVRCPGFLVGYMHHPNNMHLDAKRLIDEITALREKHGWNPTRHGVDDTVPYYLAATYRASGRRFRAARWYLRSFRIRGARRDLARAVGVLLGERVISLSGISGRTTVDPSLGRWLDAVRRAERATPTGLPALWRIDADDDAVYSSANRS